MKQKNTIYYPCGNDFIEKVVPSMKQTMEKTTNKTIECCLCPNKHVSKYLRIVDIRDIVDSIDDLDNCMVRDYCCYNCANGLKLTYNRAKRLGLLTIDNKRYYPELVMQGLPINDKGWLMDSTKDRIDEINKHRNRTKNYIKRMKDSGIYAIHKKRRSTKKSIAVRVTAKDDDEWWRKYNTMCKVMSNE